MAWMLLYAAVSDLDTILLTGTNGREIRLDGPWPVTVNNEVGRLALANFPQYLSLVPNGALLGAGTFLDSWRLG